MSKDLREHNLDLDLETASPSTWTTPISAFSFSFGFSAIPALCLLTQEYKKPRAQAGDNAATTTTTTTTSATSTAVNIIILQARASRSPTPTLQLSSATHALHPNAVRLTLGVCRLGVPVDCNAVLSACQTPFLSIMLTTQGLGRKAHGHLVGPMQVSPEGMSSPPRQIPF